MPELMVNGVAIDDTFAEAFDMRATAIVITAPTARWAAQAAATMTGFATSVIGCGCEAASKASCRRGRRPTDGPACACSCLRSRPRNCRSNCKTASGNACSPALARPVTPGFDVGRRQAQARRCNSLLRRRLADRQASRRSTVLARAGDGRGVRLRVDHLSHQASGRRRQSDCHGRERGKDPSRDRGSGESDAQGRRCHHAVSRAA